MDIRPLTEELAVAGQIGPFDLNAVVAAGYRSVICSRPDCEAEGQASLESLASASREAGLALTFAYLPVTPGRMTGDDGRLFGELIARLPQPALAHCRSGARSASLWALSQSGKAPRAQILDRAARAGLSLSGLMPPAGPAGPS